MKEGWRRNETKPKREGVTAEEEILEGKLEKEGQKAEEGRKQS